MIELFAQKLKERINQNDVLDLDYSAITKKEWLNLGKPNSNTKNSAVLILLYPVDTRIYSVLMKRPNYNGAHGNQISLPGGKKEEIDTNLFETALRETEEEIGVKAKSINFVTELKQVFVAASNYLIFPFIGFVTHKPDFLLDEREVDSIIEFDVLEWNKNFSISTEQVNVYRDGSLTEYDVPSIVIHNHIVWGATAKILFEFHHIINRAKL